MLGVLGPSEIYKLAINAGWSGADALVATAVALAESGGNPNAYNAETQANTPGGHGSYGLWQVYLKAHPEFAGMNLFDPAANASAAYAVWKQAGGSFSPWSTFKSTKSSGPPTSLPFPLYNPGLAPSIFPWKYLVIAGLVAAALLIAT